MENHILVAEDEQDMLFLIARRIERLGHKVTKAQDGEAALRHIMHNEFDVVVTDINMPGQTGLDLLAEAKSRDKYCQVIIVTANATMENAIEALNRGAFSYLTKPFDHISVISNSVERALEFRRLQLDNIRMAKAQQRRGDMLEDEVTDRVRQLSRQEQAYRELLANLPQGIIVASSNGLYLPRNPAAERWLTRDEQSQDQPITSFLDELGSSEDASKQRTVRLAGRELRLRATKISQDGDVQESLVTVEDLTHLGRSIGARIAPSVRRLSQDLSRLDLNEISNREVFLDMARQVRRLELICESLGITPSAVSQTKRAG